MDEIIREIFEKLGGSTKIARALNSPVQTVHSWLAKADIPPWRRAAVLGLVRKNRKAPALSEAAVAYLQSQERTKVSQQAAA